MWISKRISSAVQNEPAAVGEVTIGGASVGVVSGAERRGIPVFAPGGYFWKPTAGESVLIIKCGGEVCAVSTEIASYPEDMQAGEVYIKSKNGAELRLKNDGTIEIIGTVSIEGGLQVNGNYVT